MAAVSNQSNSNFSNESLSDKSAASKEHFEQGFYIAAGISSVIVLVFIVLAAVGCKKYLSLLHTIRDLQGCRSVVRIPVQDSLDVSPGPQWRPSGGGLQRALGKEEEQTPLQQGIARPRRPWTSLQPAPGFSRSDVSLLQLMKAGKEGVFYKARMTRGTCKGHALFTCKITKEGVAPKHVDMEVSIMRKLVHHKNILQLLDWNTSQEPCVLIMEFVSCGTLRSFLQTNREQLCSDPELQSLLTIASSHVALAMEHVHAKMVVHCDLALRNIMVSKFPWDVKLAEFGLARDLTCMRLRRSSRWRVPRQRVPLRWYPPEYFRNNYYSFKGDVWSFAILLWEMQTFGTLPYPNLETSQEVVYHICAGYKNKDPDGCRPEILQIMQDCWVEKHTSRPSFADIVRTLESIIEDDADYVNVENPRFLATGESENQDTKSLNTL